MKKTIIIMMMAVAFFACQTSQEETFTLTIEAEGQARGKAWLQDRVAGQMVDLDSAVFENGNFYFEGSVDFPQMYYLRIEGLPGRIAVFMENSNMNINVTQREPLEYTVRGSESYDIYANLNELIKPYDERIRMLQNEISEAEKAGDNEKIQQYRELLDQATEQKKEEVFQYITQHSDKSVGVFIAQRQLTHGVGPDELQKIYGVFDSSLRGTRYYDELETSLNTLKNVAIGKPAIDFTLDNPQGEEISLSDFRGQVVLISFWASWCPYCREENPNLVRVYEKFGDDNFEVLGVSLDRTHEAWVKAIEEDGLSWPQVSDLQGWASGPAAEYAVRSIPQNVLIDQNGTIVARNIKYHELENMLPALLSEI